MSNTLSPRRLAENEVFFRQKNRAVEHGLETTKRLATEAHESMFIGDEDMQLHFYCECSDENCQERIPLKRSQYDAIHKANDRFVIVCGHEVPGIEKIVEKTDDYCVVQKTIEPPKRVSGLKPTPISNT